MPLAWTASTYDLDSCELLYACITCIPVLLGPPVLAAPEAVSSIFLATSISFPHPVAWMIIFRFNFDTISLKRPFIVFALIIRKGQNVVCSMYLFSRNANLLFLHCHNHFVLSKVSSIFLLHLPFVFHIALGHRKKKQQLILLQQISYIIDLLLFPFCSCTLPHTNHRDDTGKATEDSPSDTHASRRTDCQHLGCQINI